MKDITIENFHDSMAFQPLGPDPSKRDGYRQTMRREAVVAFVRGLCEKDPNARDSLGRSALFSCAKNGTVFSTGLAEMLIAAGADPFKPNGSITFKGLGFHREFAPELFHTLATPVDMAVFNTDLYMKTPVPSLPRAALVFIGAIDGDERVDPLRWSLMFNSFASALYKNQRSAAYLQCLMLCASNLGRLRKDIEPGLAFIRGLPPIANVGGINGLIPMARLQWEASVLGSSTTKASVKRRAMPSV